MRRTLIAATLVALFGVAAGCASPEADDGPEAAATSSPGPPADTRRAAGLGRPPPAARPTPSSPAPEDPGKGEGSEDFERPWYGREPRVEEPGADLPPSPERELREREVVTGDIAPKSVVASGTGLFFAQNMMYRHTVTVYDRDGELVETIADRVDLSDHGIEGYPEPVDGAPVEAAFSPDGTRAYVSNYNMYGPGFDRPGSDRCSPEDGTDDSFLYRIDVEALEIDDVIAVGSVPKYVAVTPDDRFVLVSNWCSYDLSVVDVEKAREVERVEIGRYPRGIAVDPDGRTAYVAVMGSSDVAVVDLDEWSVDWLRDVGGSPRHLVMDPEGRHLYATLNADGQVAKIDRETGEVVARVATGAAPRSMAIAGDGLSLYVVNYHSDTVSKVATGDMTVVQEVGVAHRPIGITVDDATGDVWVASYSGHLTIFEEA